MGYQKHTANFADRLAGAQQAKSSRVVLGLDPQLSADGLPPGYTDVADFCCDLITACSPVIAAVKPQLAFFEARGTSGMEALRRTIAHARGLGIITIADAKRGDIGVVSEAYAEAYLGDSDFSCDAVTVNPYLGKDSISAFLKKVETGRGIFVCVKTSNKSSSDFQDLQLERGGTSWHAVGRLVHSLGQSHVGSCGLSSVGAVFGATHPKDAEAGRKLMPSTLMLVPGYGAQGASANDAIAGLRKEDGLGVVVNASRSIMYAWRNEGANSDPIEAAVEAADNR